MSEDGRNRDDFNQEDELSIEEYEEFEGPKLRPVPIKRGFKEKDKADREPLFSASTKIVLLIGAIIFLTVGIVVLTNISSNLENRLDSRAQTAQEVRKQVGRDVYEQQQRVLNQQRQAAEIESAQAEQYERELQEEQERVIEEIYRQQLEEGNEWFYNQETQMIEQRPITSFEQRTVDIEPDETFYDAETKVTAPRQNVLDWLELRNEDIPWEDERLYVTKGQFIFWITDNLLRLVGNTNEIYTRWDPDTYTLTVTTRYGNKEQVEELSRDKIINLFNNSRYKIENPNAEITVTYE